MAATEKLRLVPTLIISIIIGAVILAFDLNFPLGVAGGVPYVGLVLVGLLTKDRRMVVLLATAGSVLTILGYYLSPPGGIHHIVLINRGLALFAIWSTAIVSILHLISQEEISRLAVLDQLTGLYNRHSFFGILQKVSKSWNDAKIKSSIIVIDIDHFKKINDTHGHPAGDTVLQAIAGSIRTQVREVDTLARLGGEEFIILLPSTTKATAVKIAERIRQTVEALDVPYHGIVIRATVSVGVAELTDETRSAEALIDAADKAVYIAKELGRNRVYED